MRLQAPERRHGDVLRGRDHIPEKVDVLVQVMVVDRVDELAAQDAVHVLQVHDHSGLGIERAADGDLDHVVVTVVGGARAEDLAVLLVAPVVAAQDVRGGERGAAGDADVRGHQGSIRKLAPDSGADSGEASQTTKRATSAGSSAGPSTPAMRNIRVSTAPGLMALTRMRCSRPSTARASVRPASPDFAATYAAMPGNFSAPNTPDRLDTMTIDPPRPRINLNASRLHRNAPRSPAPSCASHSSALMSANGRLMSSAAQWINESSVSSSSNAVTTSRSLETSHPSRRLRETTFQSLARSWATTSEPMPPEPPVTTAAGAGADGRAVERETPLDRARQAYDVVRRGEKPAHPFLYDLGQRTAPVGGDRTPRHLRLGGDHPERLVPAHRADRYRRQRHDSPQVATRDGAKLLDA